MPVLGRTALPTKAATSCGTLIVNNRGEILLCHVTGTNHWDIPKGMQDPGESTFEAATRELREETGLKFDPLLFEEIGCFNYQRHKRLHLYKVRAPASLEKLDHLICTSYFAHELTGKLTPEMDGFRWAARDEVRTLCAPRMAMQLLSMSW